mmetsp:Transcript_9990/g.5203  ORF Transcript_9990/g.5203 Transcript_9990/m.5203 type:complete len:117 (+) Transcript_9990:26-376(+)
MDRVFDNWNSEAGNSIFEKIKLKNIFATKAVKDACLALKKICQNEAFRVKCFNFEPQTVLHGDYHGNNHLFPKNNESPSKDDIILVDFQFASIGRISWELVYFLNMSCESDSWEQD